ncbi:HD domain-containing protein [Candidatus Poribacteria bacterium]|nr:HD domain-containing protein [Candidatus Poribacteria bacterium]
MKTDYHEMRDPIHGFIKISTQEKELIDTEVFQRLRRIRQLAMAFLVYPGALHTRFDHSIGVMHIAARICNKLQESDPKRIDAKDIALVRLAALLHDIGHGPFSHVSEHLLDEFTYDKTDKDRVREKIHEKITVDIIQTDPEIKTILCDEERDFVIEMIEGKEKKWDWRRDIVSSELDADKMDYLLRDSYFAGVKYGLYDLEKIIESCLITERSNTPLAISSKGIYALEQLLLARHHMTQQVYWHRVSLISTEMIIRGLTLAIIYGGNAEMKRLYQYPQKNEEDSDQSYEIKKKDFIQNYLKYHDEKVIDVLKNDSQVDVPEEARDIFNRLYNRNLFKMVAEIKLKDERDPILHSQLDEMLTDKQQKHQLEADIAKCLGVEATHVIVSNPPIRILNYGAPIDKSSTEKIMVYDEDQEGLRSMIDYINELFLIRPSTDVSTLKSVQVYAATDDKEVTEKQKNNIHSILCST